jgi:uncharacterized protein
LSNASPASNFHVIAKPYGPICNLDCAYCFYLEKERLFPKAEKWSMSYETLERFIEQYIAAQASNEVHFTWQGGEPTLAGLPFFEQAVVWQQKYAAGKKIFNAFQTNGVNLDDRWCEFLFREKFLVGISIDGPEALHDYYRVYKGGRGSFHDTMRGVRLLQKHGVEFNTLATVHRANMNEPLAVYRFLKEIGSRYLQFLPIVERAAENPTPEGLTLVTASFAEAAHVTEWSVEPLAYGKFLTAIFDEWVRNDVGQIFVQIFDVSLENWLGITPSLCVFRETCGGAMAIEHTGDVYSCDHFVYPNYHLGNLASTSLRAMVSSERQQVFGTAKRDTLPEYCRQCDVRFACHGECPKHRFLITPQGEAGLNYLCAGYKHFFHHIDPYMQFMAAELRAGRPPRNVMAWAANR